MKYPPPPLINLFAKRQRWGGGGKWGKRTLNLFSSGIVEPKTMPNTGLEIPRFYSFLFSKHLYVWKCRKPQQTRDFHDLFPIFSTVIILYLVPHFSMCGSVENRDLLGIFTTCSPSLPRYLQFYTFLCVEVWNTVTNQGFSRLFPHLFHGYHSLLSFTLLCIKVLNSVARQTEISVTPVTFHE